MNKIGVFYGSTTGTTEDLARRIAEKLDVPSAHNHRTYRCKNRNHHNRTRLHICETDRISLKF